MITLTVIIVFGIIYLFLFYRWSERFQGWPYTSREWQKCRSCGGSLVHNDFLDLVCDDPSCFSYRS